MWYVYNCNIRINGKNNYVIPLNPPDSCPIKHNYYPIMHIYVQTIIKLIGYLLLLTCLIIYKLTSVVQLTSVYCMDMYSVSQNCQLVYYLLHRGTNRPLLAPSPTNWYVNTNRDVCHKSLSFAQM